MRGFPMTGRASSCDGPASTSAAASSTSSAFARSSISPKSGASGQLTDVYAAWTKFPAASVKFGQFKTPFGFEQLYLDSRLFTIERSLANDRLTLSRQIGAQLYGDVVPERLTYAAGVFNGSGTNTTTNDNDRFLAVARVAFTPLLAPSLRVNAAINGFTTRDTAGAFGPEFGFVNNVFTGRRTGAGADLQLVAGPLEVWTEYIETTFDPTTGRSSRASGWYAQAAWFTASRRWQFIGKLDAFDPNEQRANDRLHTVTLGTNYMIHGDDLKMQLDWLRTSTGHRFLARLQTIF